jgi:hypothetical protein
VVPLKKEGDLASLSFKENLITNKGIFLSSKRKADVAI